MFNVLIRVVIIYIIVIVAVRLMGKRQVGEMQPTELVITILLSEIATIPVGEEDKELLPYIVAVLLLAAFEIINSIAALRNNRYRMILQGKSVTVIRNGVIDQKRLRRLRVTLDDLMEALREKGIFNPNDVSCAVLETNGKLSVMPKPENRPPTAGDLHLNIEDKGMPVTVIYDGRIIESDFAECNMTLDKVKAMIKKNNVTQKQILLMTVDAKGNENIIIKGQ